MNNFRRIRKQRQHYHLKTFNAIRKFVIKFVSILSAFSLVDLGASFSLPSSSVSISTSTFYSSVNHERLFIYSCDHRQRALTMSNTDDNEVDSDFTLVPTNNNGDDDDDGDGEKNKINNWFFALVLPLQLVYVSNQWSRSSIYYLVDFSSESGGGNIVADSFRYMNVAIGFTELQYGLLASLAFTALFAVASLGAGVAADRYDRKLLIVLSTVGWSVATVGTALSTTYTEVLSWRIVMGLFCAFATPAAYTLIADKVPKDRLSLSTSIYGTGIAFGGALASLSILLDNEYGWSQTLLIVGGAGLFSACLVFLVLPSDDDAKESSITTSTDVDESLVSYSFIEVVSTTRAKWIYGGSFLRFSSGLTIGVWSAPYFRAAFPDNANDYAVAQALITALAGSASGLIGGAAADYLSSAPKNSPKNKSNTNDYGDDTNTVKNVDENSSDEFGKNLWVPVIGSLLAAPTWYLAIHSTESFQLAMVWLTIEYLVAECWFGPTISTLLSTVPSKLKGTSQGLFTLTGAMANLSPTFLGYLYSYGQASSATSTVVDKSSSELLPILLSTGVCFGYISAAFCFAMGARSPPPLAATTNKSKSS